MNKAILFDAIRRWSTKRREENKKLLANVDTESVLPNRFDDPQKVAQKIIWQHHERKTGVGGRLATKMDES